jgi:3D (Asp-Asp-Asp) domain-containing protein
MRSLILALILSWSVSYAAEEHWIMAEVTAYCPCRLCTPGLGITANGTKVSRVPYNLAADCSLPFGSRVFLPLGFGALDKVRQDERWFCVDDRGGALDTEASRYQILRIDLRVMEHWWAVQFGRKTIPVLIKLPLDH